MWPISKPSETALSTFDCCIEGISNPDLKRRFMALRHRIVDAELEFDRRATDAALHLIEEETTIGEVSSDDMVKLYERHLARSGSRGRKIYDAIKMSAIHGQCPFCGHLPVSTLDHSLPKNSYAALALTPVNLIPCCKDCNHKKGVGAPQAAEQQFIHAYYDDLTQDRWLYAEIVRESPPHAIYYVDVPLQWDDLTKARVEWHFAKLELSNLYASQAGRELQNIRGSLSRTYKAAGADAVRLDLRERSASCEEVTLNSWNGALYDAASRCQWYCEGGFSA